MTKSDSASTPGAKGHVTNGGRAAQLSPLATILAIAPKSPLLLGLLFLTPSTWIFSYLGGSI